MKRVPVRTAALGMVLSVVVIAPGVAQANVAEQFVVPRDAVVFGRTYGDWMAQWQQWAMSLPAEEHPLFNEQVACSAGQSGPVWFLGGKFCAPSTVCPSPTPDEPRPCAVPAGTYLFFPVVNYGLSALEFGDPNATIAVLRRTIAAEIDKTLPYLSAELDGRPIRNVADYRVQSPVYGFTLPQRDLLSAIYPSPPGPFAPGWYTPAVDDGVYLMLQPLRPGVHTLRFRAYFPFPPPSDFWIDVSYRITVK